MTQDCATGGDLAAPLAISILYCSTCHHEPVVLRLTERILKLKHRVARLELIPWEQTDLQLHVNGHLLASLSRDGSFPDPDALIHRLRHWQPDPSPTPHQDF